MKTIWKYEIDITDYQLIAVKEGAIPLHVGLDPSGIPCIWCKLETGGGNGGPHEFLGIYIVGTGNQIPHNAQIHLGSFNQGPLVWHVFTIDKEFPI